ncbi:MAG: holo-ACP synthase [Anaerolineae bacterium]
MAMVRCGIDMIEIDRVEASAARFGERFMLRFFTEGERLDCEGQMHRLAARIAAKEAVSKALGTGIGDIRWVDVEVRIDNPRKRPTLILHGRAAEVAAELGLVEWDISLSHTRTFATAVVVALGRA